MIIHKLNILSRIEKEKGTGCNMPKTDPFAKEVMRFMDEMVPVTCNEKDWVTCDGDQCFVVKDVLDEVPYIECEYRDIIYINDDYYYLDSPIKLRAQQRFNFTKSDHVKVTCLANNRNPNRFQIPTWSGLKAGFRPVSVSVPPGREDSVNVLILTFDSVSHNHFLRSVPQAYKILTEELGAVVFNNYNVVGDGTLAALFPILTGKTELEFPDVRRKLNNFFPKHLNPMDFLFGQLHKDGYHTAYFEDLPKVGTFTNRLNGFRYQPADHYLRSFFLEDFKIKLTEQENFFCIGATPTFRFLMNLTSNFIMRDGKRFGFAVISDIAHEEPTLFSSVANDLSKLLKTFKASGILENTLFIVMSDHGSRFTPLRRTYQGKIEERLPFMSIVLPNKLKRARPDAETFLRANVDVLTTPFDIHTTILDVVGLKHLINNYTVSGSDLPRGMSLLKPIPKSRSCSEADVLTHWCVCLNWTDVSPGDKIYEQVAIALAKFINKLIADNDKCATRSLISIEWVKRENVNDQVLKFIDVNTPSIEFYQVKIVMSPMYAAYESTITYLRHLDEILISEQLISRVNAYGQEPKCVMNTHPHLNKYCYCKICFNSIDECKPKKVF
ncbi:uncharacterized protein LOC113227811 [Hyposmocoma kahamanoa]|uniref:uncharacterized protein LOC113227811 n=1 Tax=Hyposmocoma kahamanoa TaxID=1477025 RepID=UPI000E6D63D2|nr:uncharacterized protein LOC113227811 [Hyposmocoma kahamanoa]